MLRSDNRVNDGGEIVNIGKGFNTENDIVECTTVSNTGGIFGIADNCEEELARLASVELRMIARTMAWLESFISVHSRSSNEC